MGLLFGLTAEIITCNIAKSLFQHYCQHLKLNHNHILAESAFNFYVNNRIAYLLGTSVNTESVRKTFYHELIQNTSLSTNHNFTSIITEINKKIEHHTQQRYPITYLSKSKKKLQTPAVIPKQIQPPTWKKNQVELPTNSSYYYIPKSAINILLTDASTSNATSIFECFLFQKNPETETPNFQMQHNQNNRNPDINNQQHLPSVIMINPPPALPINKQQQQLHQPSQQPQQLLLLPQQQLQQLLQQQIIAPMAYRKPSQPIDGIMPEPCRPFFIFSKIPPIHDIKAWLTNLNNNSINQLANTFITIKQGENEAVTPYLERFHRNLHQIQTIQADYFTAPQILNQFIRDLCSSILQCICPIHLADFQAIVNNIRDFEAAELEANHAQAVNLVMNGSFELDSKLKQFSNSINQKLEGYLADNCAIYQPPQQRNNLGITNCPQNQSHLLSSPNQPTFENQLLVKNRKPTIKKSILKPRLLVPNSELPIQLSTILTDLPANDTTANISTTHISTSSLSTAATANVSTTAATNNLLGTHSHQVDCTASARIITADGATKTPIDEIDDFPIEINSIIISIKVLVMEAIQYQALVGNNWLSKTNATLDWTTQKLRINLNGQHIRVPATYGHFKPSNIMPTALLIEFEEEENKPMWEAY
ncbi:hypothetical protein G9A89_004545 [Geosiphon pyriformis]|nr:hypothetical protein G9A89_004545 [Geosiphon pyriformis]